MYDFSILMSIKPRFTHEIFQTKNKKAELRKSRPAHYDGSPFIVYVYESGSGNVIGHFTCGNIINLDKNLPLMETKLLCSFACVTSQEFFEYNPTQVYKVENPIFYINPIPYSKFAQAHKLSDKPPQSWCYINSKTKKC